ncbi:hypothetical protein BH10ACI2_BH10ACI2_18220 [soil metagenome]
MAFSLGLAAVFSWNGWLIASNEVAVDLPVITSKDDVLVIFPADESVIYPYGYQVQKNKVIGDRDLSLYDIGEYSDPCGYRPGSEETSCLRIRSAARHFVDAHRASQRRGYLEIGLPCMDCGPVYHIFIEPDVYGRWGFVITLATNGPGRTSRGHTLKFRRPTFEEKNRDDPNEILSFLNDSGREVESF